MSIPSRLHLDIPLFQGSGSLTAWSFFDLFFCIALFALSALSPAIVQIVQKVQSDFLHGTNGTIGTIKPENAKSVKSASAFFHRPLCQMSSDTHPFCF
jgi:hypothetical protein